MTLVNTETGEVVATITKDEAHALTARIKGHVAQAWRLLSEAHERRAYLALGYSSWGAYVEAEFDMSRGHAYRLLDMAAVIKELEAGLIAASWNIGDGESPNGDGEVSPMGDTDVAALVGSVTERVTRELAPLLDQPALLVEAFVDAKETTAAENREPQASDMAEAVERTLERHQVDEDDDAPTGPTDTDTNSPWALKQRAKAAEDARIAAEKKALDQARTAFRKQLDKARPLVTLSTHETAGLLDGTDSAPTRSFLLDLAGWCRDLAELLNPNQSLGGTP